MTEVCVMNATRRTTLAERARVADDGIARIVGLLGRRMLPAGSGLVLRRCKSVHTFGMRFAIDVIYVEDHDVVLHAIAELSPWHEGPVEPRCAAVIELPAGTIAATGTTVGDQLALTPANDSGK
jgi:uncharacterized membrane protein (UPF0127 family)